MRIGLLSINDPRKGLWRDAETVLWALQEKPVRHNGRWPAAVTLFAVSDYRQITRKPAATRAERTRVPCPSAVPPGTTFSDWLSSLDVLVTWEKFLPKTVAYVQKQGVRVIYIPHLEWCELGGSVSRWLRAVRDSDCQVWAKTEQVATTLRKANVRCELVPWSIPDPVLRQHSGRAGKRVTFLINAGMGGWRNRRGVDLALEGYAVALEEVDNLDLILKSIKPLHRYVPERLLSLPRIEAIEGLISRDALAKLRQRADAVLYPSRWEGFGLSLLEALHAGLPVLASDGWPMNELIEHRHNGLLARAEQVGQVRLAPHWECDPQALAEQMIAFAHDSDLRRRLTCPEPAELVARQHHFRLRVRQLLLQEPRARVIVCRRRKGTNWRRSEEYWADALRRHGYAVDVVHYESSVRRLRKQLSKAHDFVLVSKAPVNFLQTVHRLTKQPIILWHHDACKRRQRWLQHASRLVNLIGIPESGLENRISGLRAPILRLMPGAKVDGDRGPGRRPISLAPPDLGPDVVFLGNDYRKGNRVRVLRALSSRFDVHVFGRRWRKGRWRVRPPVWSNKAAAVNRSAHIVLSVSNTAEIPHYTSNRLFNACGVGACVIAEAYPGLDDHYPPQAVARFHRPSECADIVGQLLANDAKRARMRELAEDHTWRHHTWNDRVFRLLNAVRTLPATRAVKTEATRMWEARARRLGARAVGYYRWDETEFRQETDAWWQRLYTHLESSDAGNDQVILDFGCGAGRFGARLAEEGYRVIGVDISSTLLNLATDQTQCGLELVQIAPGETLPFPAGAFDVLWANTVLQHVPQELFTTVVSELRRVLRPRALLILCENTEQSKGRKSRSGHVTYRREEEYVAAFPGLKAVNAFTVAREQHTIFVGRMAAVGAS